MGEEAHVTDFDLLASGALREAVKGGGGGGGGGGEGEDKRMLEWEAGLPSDEELTPLSQMLIPPELASVFSVPLSELKTVLDVHHAAQQTISNLVRLHQNSSAALPPVAPPYKRRNFSPPDGPVLQEVVDHDESLSTGKEVQLTGPGMYFSVAGTAVIEGISSPLQADNSVDDNSTRTSKRPRLVWTPQLHKRFMDVVDHLGIKNAVPKTIMQLMNVEGLTRENVASHLQKYRLYVKRLQGDSDEGPSSSSFDPLFASIPVQQSLHEQQLQQPMSAPMPMPVPVPMPAPMPMPYTVPMIIPMPVYGMPHHHAHGLVPENSHQSGMQYNGVDALRSYVPNNLLGGRTFGSIASYPHFSPKNT